jgi:hypothetical protein
MRNGIRIGTAVLFVAAAVCCGSRASAQSAAPASDAGPPAGGSPADEHLQPGAISLPAELSPPGKLSSPAKLSPPVECPNPQSPRRLEHYDQQPSFSIGGVSDSTDSIRYTRLSDGKRFVLKRCGQHYHCEIENVQPDCDQHRSPGDSPGECAWPVPGQWVEIHTVFSTKPAAEDCDPETLECCKSDREGDPVLVMAYHAKVTKEGPPLQPIPVPWGAASATWTGSTTGTKPPEPCKPLAYWNFILGCGYTVSEKQLALFCHMDPARPLQRQLSKDLFRTPPQ